MCDNIDNKDQLLVNKNIIENDLLDEKKKPISIN
jgi:hypothetical protein